MANIALNKPSGGQLILSPEDGTSTETVTIPSVGVMAADASTGKVLNLKTYYNNNYSISASGAWVTHWSPSYTPVSATSTLHVIFSYHILNEGSNMTDLFVDWRGANGQFYMSFGKAGSLSGWNSMNNSATYTAPSGGTTAANFSVQYRSNGANSYINYNGGSGYATSTFTIIEVEAA